ncbi:hypothetical protein [Streptomyces sp. NPDC004376]
MLAHGYSMTTVHGRDGEGWPDVYGNTPPVDDYQLGRDRTQTGNPTP